MMGDFGANEGKRGEPSETITVGNKGNIILSYVILDKLVRAITWSEKEIGSNRTNK